MLPLGNQWAEFNIVLTSKCILGGQKLSSRKVLPALALKDTFLGSGYIPLLYFLRYGFRVLSYIIASLGWPKEKPLQI